MIAVLCALLSGAGFYLSTDLGEVWPLAWLAPVPVLWLAFGGERGWAVAAGAFAAVALGATNLLGAYGGVFPWQALAIVFTVPPALFAAIVLGARVVARRVHPLAGQLAFAALWTAWDFLASFGPDGTAASPAYSQVGAPLLIQSASLFGLWSITFLLGFVAAGLALALRTRTMTPALLALALFAANAGFGALRLAQAPAAPALRIGLVADDAIGRAAFADDPRIALQTIAAYAGAARALAPAKPQLIVLPEHFAVLRDAWREPAARSLQVAADTTGAAVVAGLDERGATARRNIAWVFLPNGGTPLTYVKRRLVPGLEAAFTPGGGALALPGGIAVAICKDMDFQAMLRADAASTSARVMAVPAWDFGADGYGHARMAILRGVENGFAVARAARDGLLTLSDAHGRVTASLPSNAFPGFVTLAGRLAPGEGGTLYGRIGDAFAWLMLALSALLLGLAFSRRLER